MVKEHCCRAKNAMNLTKHKQTERQNRPLVVTSGEREKRRGKMGWGIKKVKISYKNILYSTRNIFYTNIKWSIKFCCTLETNLYHKSTTILKNLIN